MTLFGIDRLLADSELRRPLDGKRVAILAHPASVTRDLTHSLDALVASGLNVSAGQVRHRSVAEAFGLELAEAGELVNA